MLALFRRSQRFLLIIILGVIIFTFVIWGGLSGSRYLPARSSRLVGYIGTQPVTSDELASAVRGVLINLRMLGYPRELLNMSEEMEREGWRRLIQFDQARKDGVAASSDEVSDLIMRLLFGDSQSFDPAAYRRMVAEIGGNMKPREFEEHIRNTLLIEKVRQILAQCALVTDEDVRIAYDNDRTLVQLGYVPFYFTNYLAGQVVTSNELVEFFNTNQEEFRVPPQVHLTLALEPTRLEEASVTEEDAREYYDDNLDDFLITNAPATAEGDYKDEYLAFDDVRTNIMARLRRSRAEEAAYDRVEQLFFALSGMTMRDVAERDQAFKDAAANLEISTLETGPLTLDDTIPGITNTYDLVRDAFGMDAGDFSEMVEIPDVGYAMYIVTDKRDSYLPELDEIESKVYDEIVMRRAREAAGMAAAQLRSQLAQSTGSFSDAVAALGYTAYTTQPLNRTEGIDPVGCPPETVARLFAFPVKSLVVAPCDIGSLLVCPLKIYDADEALMYAEIDDYRERLARQAQALLFNMWFASAAGTVRVTEQLYQPGTDELENR